MDIKITITRKRISDILINALEGGANYWYMIEKEVVPDKFEFENDDGARFKKEGKHWMQDYPLNPGGGLLISDETGMEEGDKKKQALLTLGKIKMGLKIMALSEPAAFGDFLAENDDGNTADIFLQCCIFGEVIYG